MVVVVVAEAVAVVWKLNNSIMVVVESATVVMEFE